MVDPIEIKLDEIDAKIDQIAYAPKYKPTYEIEEMMKKGGGTGGGLAGAGMVAGATGAVTLELLNVLKDTLKQSKIYQTVQDQIGKALGLLVDLVLLPFLPLLTFGIIQLYQAILEFGTWWKTVWDTIKKEGLIGLVKLGLQWVWDQLMAWEKSFLEWLFGDETLGQKIVDLILGLKTLLGGVFGYIGEKAIGAILDFVFGTGTYDKAKQAVINIAVNLLNDPLGWLAFAVGWLFGAAVHIAVDILALNLSIVNKTIEAFWGFVDWLWGVITGKVKLNVFEILLSIIPKDPGAAIWSTIDWLKSGASGLASQFLSGVTAGYSAVPSFDTGGTVGKTGLAVVHEGETISPAGSPSQIHLNFYGLTNEQLPDVIMQTLRQYGARYQV